MAYFAAVQPAPRESSFAEPERLVHSNTVSANVICYFSRVNCNIERTVSWMAVARYYEST